MEAHAFEQLLIHGLRLGEWVGWRVEFHCAEHEFDVMLIHPTGQAVYLPVFNSGWLTARIPDGVWLLWDIEGASPEAPGEPALLVAIFDEIRDRQPAADWPIAEVRLSEWSFRADSERLTAWHEVDRVPCVFHRYRPLWTRDKKPLTV